LACRTVSREAAKRRSLLGVPESKKTDLIPADGFEAWADATFATDPVGAASTPPVLRAPNGVVAGGRACYIRPLLRTTFTVPIGRDWSEVTLIAVVSTTDIITTGFT
jgi:hypothetical protein